MAVFEQYGKEYNPILLGQKEEKMRRFCLYDLNFRKNFYLPVSPKIYFLFLLFLNMMESIFFMYKLCSTVLALEDRSVVYLF